MTYEHLFSSIRPRLRAAIAALSIMATLGWTVVAEAQLTAFTYQGKLKSDGAPANGDFDMVFRLFDDAEGGTQYGADMEVLGQTVVDGLFTVRLDPGPGLFYTAGRWLEVEVSGQVLSPRQEITATPFAQTCEYAYVSDYAAYTSYSYAPWVPTGLDLYYVDGNVGIGTSEPTAKLEVAGVPGVDGIKFPDGTLQLTAATGGGGGTGEWQSNGTDLWYGGGGVGVIGGSSPFPGGKGVFLEGGSPSVAHVFAFNYDSIQPLALSLNSPGGNVGIGTTSPAARLDVTGTWDGNDGALTLRGSRPTLKLHGGTSPFYHSWIMQVWNGFTGNGSLAFYHQGAPSGAWTNYFNLSNEGEVGIGTAAPLAKLDIINAGEGAQLLRFGTERPWVFQQGYSGPSAALQLKSTVGIKEFDIVAAGGTVVAQFWADDANPRLVVNGRTITKILEITGADLAEKFPTSGGRAEPGMVMEIDPDHAGLLRVSREPYNHRVAGIVSGANEFAAGAILGNLPGSEDAPAIALSGRVYVNCDAADGAITPGDLLTTSATPGHAMKAVDRDRAHGAILGKAMTALPKGQRGLVLVLVSLQ